MIAEKVKWSGNVNRLRTSVVRLGEVEDAASLEETDDAVVTAGAEYLDACWWEAEGGECG